MENMTERVIEMANRFGVNAVGIATTETLAGGPPSTDLRYVLPKAKSAISFLLNLNQEYIEPYLQKKERLSHESDNVRTTTLSSGLSYEMANYLNQKGHKTVPVAANMVYRTDTPNGPLDEKPPISHRYIAVRSGIGHFGFSGNVITKENGAAVILGSVVTEAELIPTEALPPEENYCDNCKLCLASCASGYMSEDETVSVTMGGVDFSYSKKRHHNRCDYVCGGFSGLSKSGKWSTWSPGRFPIPEKDEEFMPAIIKSAEAYQSRPREGGGFFHFLMPGNRVEVTCGNCAIVCHPDKDVRKKRHKMLKESGVVIQNPDGSRVAVSPEKAKQRLNEMPHEIKKLYEPATE